MAVGGGGGWGRGERRVPAFTQSAVNLYSRLGHRPKYFLQNTNFSLFLSGLEKQLPLKLKVAKPKKNI
jgi:hypothetical protein